MRMRVEMLTDEVAYVSTKHGKDGKAAPAKILIRYLPFSYLSSAVIILCSYAYLH